MKASNGIAFLAGACAAVALVLAFAQWRSATRSAAELRAAQQQHEALQAQIRVWAGKVRSAEQRAADAERDAAELLKAVNATRVASAPLPKAMVPTRAIPAAATVSSPELQIPEEEKQRLARERKYQQDLAKKRAMEAKARAEFDIALIGLDPAAKFHRLIERAVELARNAEFQFAIRAYNEAMTQKPPDLAVPEEVRALQAILQEQNSPVSVTLNSDGETWVTIANVRPPARLTSAAITLLPGNYEVIGSRAGYRDVMMLLQVRAGMPAPSVTVRCTQPVSGK